MNEFLTYQIIIFGFCALQVLRGIGKLVKKKNNVREFILAFFIWSSFAILGFFPNLSSFVARWLGFQLGINFLLVISVLVLLYHMLKQNVYDQRIETEITKLVRNQSLEKMKGYIDLKK